MRTRLALGLGVALVYALFSYGGIRSPDGEVLYRTAESLAEDGDFTIEPLEVWPEFGVARGAAGACYGKYGPGLPLLASPLAWIGSRLCETGSAAAWLGTRGPSHYFGDGYAAMREHRAPSDPAGHCRRGVVAWLNVIVGALCAVAAFGALERLKVGPAGALAGSLALAFGTPMLAYSGTFFAEPLVTLCLLAALGGLLGCDPRLGGAGFGARRLFVPGAWLGLALAVHASALLWIPFLGAYAALPIARDERPLRSRAAALSALSLGTAVAVAGLLAFNVVRFGGVLETGRPAEDFLFVAPWRNALPLLASWGKGLFVYCPLGLVGLAAWPVLLERRRLLSGLLLGGVAARLVLFAAFHDWHGGFGPGPRYLLPEMALLALPAALGLDRLLGRRIVPALAVVCLCIVEQAWLAAGEVFSWGHRWRSIFEARGSDVFVDDLLYRSFELSPLSPAFGLEGVPGPALGRALGLSPAAFATLAAVLLCATSMLAILESRRRAGAS